MLYFAPLIGEMLRTPKDFIKILRDQHLTSDKITSLLRLYRDAISVDQLPPTPERGRVYYQNTNRDPMPDTRHVFCAPLTRAPTSGKLALLIELIDPLSDEDEFLGTRVTEATIERHELRLISDQNIDRLLADTN